MVWDDGSRYEGNWALDEFSGDGTYYYNNGDIYIGNWQNGKKHGKGIFSWKSGNTYEGIWVEGKRSGVGVMTMKMAKNGPKECLTYLIKFEYIILQYLKFFLTLSIFVYIYFNINISKFLIKGIRK